MIHKEALLMNRGADDLIYEITVGGTGAKAVGYGYPGAGSSYRKLSPKCPDLIQLRTYWSESKVTKRWRTYANPSGTYTRLDTGRSLTIQGSIKVSSQDYFLGTEVGKVIKVKYEPL